MKNKNDLNRSAVANDANEPVWHVGKRVWQGDVPADVACWLFDNASLTKRLKQAGHGDFRVEFLGQQWRRPLRCERRVLGMGDRAVALVRQVRLYCGGKLQVYARTVMPKTSLSGPRRQLARLGGRPLGEMLFRDRTMRRDQMEVARLEAGDLFYERAFAGTKHQNVPIWGRRSVFWLGGKPLLVNEVFLPPMPEISGFRIKRKV